MGEIDGPLVVAAVATATGAALQAASGLGFALVASPALFAVVQPTEAVAVVLALSLVLNCLVLFSERRPLAIRWSAVGPIVAGGAPGLVLGTLLLAWAPKDALQVLVGVVVVTAGLLEARKKVAAEARVAPHWPSYPVGLGAGVLTTTTGVNGPPLLLWLLRLARRPDEVRDSLTTCFLVLNVGGALAVVVLGGSGRELDVPLLLWLIPLVALGYVAGQAVFRRLEARRFRALALALVVGAGAASVAAGLA